MSATPRRAWFVWGVGVVAYAVAVFQRTSLGVAAEPATHRFGVNATVLSTFAVAQLLVYAAMQIPVGSWWTGWGRGWSSPSGPW